MNKLSGRRGKHQISPYHTKRALLRPHQLPVREAPGTSRRETEDLVLKGQRQTTHLEDVVTMMAWEILMMKQKIGALRCGANFVVVLRDNTWKQKMAEVCEGWCTKQQEKDDGSAHPWACSKRGAAFGCVISSLNKAAFADTLSVARITDLHPGWTKVGFSEMAKKPGTAYLGPSNQFTPSTRMTSHGLGWPLFVLMHQRKSWNNFGP